MERLTLCFVRLTAFMLIATMDMAMCGGIAETANSKAKPATSAVAKYWLYIGGGILVGTVALQSESAPASNNTSTCIFFSTERLKRLLS